MVAGAGARRRSAGRRGWKHRRTTCQGRQASAPQERARTAAGAGEVVRRGRTTSPPSHDQRQRGPTSHLAKSAAHVAPAGAAPYPARAGKCGQMTVLPREKRKKGTAGRGSATFPPPGPRVTLAPGWAPLPPPSSLPLLPLATSTSPPVCIAFPSSPRVSHSSLISPHLPCSPCWQNLLLVLLPQRKRGAVCYRAERRKLLDLSPPLPPPSAGSAPRRWDSSPELPSGDPR